MPITVNEIISLNTNCNMPKIGLGTYQLTEPSLLKSAINKALEYGYRLFDTAQVYQNEKLLGHIFKESTLARESLFITSKIANHRQGYQATLKAFDQSLLDLQVEYIDLFLVHWPLSNTLFETWAALEKLYAEKKVRAIGVCNFQIDHLALLLTRANIKPMVNQIELHPYLTQIPLINYMRCENIAIQAWGPLARNHIVNDPVLSQIGDKYHKTVHQITLRWHLQNGYAVIPKSGHPSRIEQNSAIFDFELTNEEMIAINQLNRNLRIGRDPDEIYKNNGY